MPDYEKMYFQLSAAVEDAVEMVERALQKGENDYVEMEDDEECKNLSD